MKSQKILEMTEVALMSAVLCVVSPFAIPIPMSPVPLSPATFVVYLAGVLLGGKQGALCVLVYLLLGAVGLPVFSGFSGGIGALLGPTGGYLIGYMACAALIGWLTKAKMMQSGSGTKRGGCFWKRRFIRNLIALCLGTLVCYILGTVWFLFVMDGSYTFGQAVLVCVVPYLVFDFVKILAAAAVLEPIGKIIRNRR